MASRTYDPGDENQDPIRTESGRRSATGRGADHADHGQVSVSHEEDDGGGAHGHGSHDHTPPPGHLAVEPGVYGMTVEFADPDELLAATHRAREAGYTRMDAYSPFPIHGLTDALRFDDWRLPWMIFGGAVAGCTTGIALQYFVMVADYAWNVGGRPLLSWPQMIPIAYECTILFAAFTAVFGMFALNKLPQPYQSIMNAPNFDRASQDRFFLCIEAHDPKFGAETATFLRGLNGALNVAEVAK